MLRYGFLRVLLLLTLCSAVLALAGLAIGLERIELPLTIAAVTLVVGVTALDLARSARRVIADFRKGQFADARRGTRWLLRWSLRKASRATLQLNLAACHLADGDFERGGAELAAIDRQALPEGVLGIWENNRAYYLLGTAGDPEQALALCDEATGLNPSNPAFRSTRGIALLAAGRTDDAIAELQTAVDVGLERQGVAALAENYHHLGQAWERLGESAYARDHYLKSVNSGPHTRYGRLSAARLQRSTRPAAGAAS